MLSPNTSDWQLFQQKIEYFRERYLKDKNEQLVQLLTDPKQTSTEQFWDTLDLMNREKKVLQDCLDGHSKSQMFFYMAIMLRHGMLKEEDLDEFSPELRERLL